MSIRRCVVICLVSGCLALATIQFWIGAFIYRPAPLDRTDPEAWDIRGALAMKARYGDGTAITGWWHRPTQADAPVILIAHGRSANIASRAKVMQRLAADGMGVLMFDYRGYGASSGRPSEQNLDQDALAVYRWIRRQGIPPRHIVVVGQSLGNSPATALAANQPVGALLLVSPFTNLPDALAERLPWLPVRLLPWTRNRFDVAASLPRFGGPTLFVVSENDGIVPIRNARRLQAIIPRPYWLDASPLRHNGMLEAVAEDGRLTKAIRRLLHDGTTAFRSGR